MSSDKLSDINLHIPSGLKCSNCEKKLGKTYGWLKTHNHFVCICGARKDWRPEQVSNVVKDVAKFRADGIKKIRRALTRPNPDS